MCFNYKGWRNKLKDTTSGFMCSHFITLQHSSDFFFQNYSIQKEKCFGHYHLYYDRPLVVLYTSSLKAY